MKVILHIGTEKTGTSSIQEFLLQNKKELARQGFFYLHMRGRNEYRAFPAYCMNEGRVDDYFRHNGIVDKKERERFDRDFFTSYKQGIELIPEGIHTVIVSSEHFASRLKKIEEVSRAKKLIEQDFSSAQVVCYLRNQVAKVCSGYSTRIKTGGIDSFNEYFNLYINNSWDEYDKRLSPWSEVFGFENINVRLFDQSAFIGGTLLDDFCNTLSETLFEHLELPVERHNESLSRLGCEVMRRVNYLFPECIRGNSAIENHRVNIIRMIARFVKGDRVRLNAEQIQQISQRYGLANERTCDKYFPDRSHLFESGF
jgi:hypothetical protein